MLPSAGPEVLSLVFSHSFKPSSSAKWTADFAPQVSNRQSVKICYCRAFMLHQQLEVIRNAELNLLSVVQADPR